MIEKIDILQQREGGHLGFHSGKEAAWLLGIVVLTWGLTPCEG